MTHAKYSQQVKDELRAMMERTKAKLLLPRNVVEYARKHKGTALHDAFEWDDAKASDAYRIMQARWIIADVRCEIPTDRKPIVTYEYVSLTQDRVKGGYRRMTDVLQSQDLRAKLFDDAKEEFKRWRSKYYHLNDLLARVFKAGDDVFGK